MNILIADDDMLIRKWLGLLITQAEQCETGHCRAEQCETRLYQAENGRDALEIIVREEVDLLITDIKMPVVDGVELIRRAKEVRPRIRIVVLSAYDDYNYVRTTLKSGVLDYLLKAEMDLKDIHNILRTVEQDIFLEDTMARNDREQMLNDCLPNAELFRIFWEDKEKSGREFLEKTKAGLEERKLFLAMLSVEGRGRISLSHSKIIVIISNILRGKNIRNVALPYFNDSFLIIYNSQETIFERQKEENGLLMSYIDSALKRFVDCRISNSINVRLNTYEELRVKIQEEEQVLLNRRYYQTDRIQSLKNSDKEEAFLKKYRLHLKAALDNKNFILAREVLEKFLQRSHEEYLDSKMVVAGCTGMLYHILNFMSVLTGRENLSVTEEDVMKIMELGTAKELEEYVQTILGKIENDLDTRQKKYSPAIEKSILYIEEHCTEKLSLEQVGNYVFLNKNYFSELFKKEVGMNYNDYLNEAKIRKACGYLAEGAYSLAEVAQMAGFSDQNYFAKIFKKVVGETPVAYKKRITGTG